jgi:hypothetical protein
MEVEEMRKVLGSETPAEILQDKLNSDTESPIKKLAELQALKAETHAIIDSLEQYHEHLTTVGVLTMIPIEAGILIAAVGSALTSLLALHEGAAKPMPVDAPNPNIYD